MPRLSIRGGLFLTAAILSYILVEAISKGALKAFSSGTSNSIASELMYPVGLVSVAIVAGFYHKHVYNWLTGKAERRYLGESNNKKEHEV